jgi:hypothetical protein
MLKFTSVSGSLRAITDITLTVTIIRTGITITDRTTGTADIVIIATIITVITGTSLIGIATQGWLEPISSQPNFLSGKSRGNLAARNKALYFPDFGEAAGLVTGLLPGSSSWNSFLNC